MLRDDERVPVVLQVELYGVHGARNVTILSNSIYGAAPLTFMAIT